VNAIKRREEGDFSGMGDTQDNFAGKGTIKGDDKSLSAMEKSGMSSNNLYGGDERAQNT